MKTLLSVFAAFALIAFLAGAALSAMEREDKARDELRAERCARWGENIPKELEPYCEGLGV